MSVCKTCNQPTVTIKDVVVHVEGGSKEQSCNACHWKGGQIGGFTNCPQCGDATNLSVTHSAN